MGTIYSRGTKTRPRYYLYFRDGSNPDGTPRYIQRVSKGSLNKQAAREDLARIEAHIARGEAWEHGKQVVQTAKPHMEHWIASLTNRNAAADIYIINRDLIPRWGSMQLEEITLRELFAWLEELKATGMASGTQKHRLSLLSRFFTWCIEQELTEVNPVKMIPQGRRPSARREKDIPFLDDDSLIPAIMKGLGNDVGLMYYLARFSGLREGEVAALRLSDLDFVSEGVIRARYSFYGPLKESHDGSKPSKWCPAPIDVVDVLRLHIARRKLSGAGPEDLLFPYTGNPSKIGMVRTGEWATWKGWHPKAIRKAWNVVATELKLTEGLTFYAATRHTYVTKALTAGVSLDEVSAAVGHALPATTKQNYDHLIRKTFNPLLRMGLRSSDD